MSRYLKAHATSLISNDFEDYAAVIGRCYLCNASTVDLNGINEIVDDLNVRVETEELPPGFIEELYAPRDESNITTEDRVFYTRENARRLDNYRRLFDSVPDGVGDMLLGPLLSKASIHRQHGRCLQGVLQGSADQSRPVWWKQWRRAHPDKRQDHSGTSDSKQVRMRG